MLWLLTELQRQWGAGSIFFKRVILATYPVLSGEKGAAARETEAGNWQ